MTPDKIKQYRERRAVEYEERALAHSTSLECFDANGFPIKPFPASSWACGFDEGKQIYMLMGRRDALKHAIHISYPISDVLTKTFIHHMNAIEAELEKLLGGRG